MLLFYVSVMEVFRFNPDLQLPQLPILNTGAVFVYIFYTFICFYLLSYSMIITAIKRTSWSGRVERMGK